MDKYNAEGYLDLTAAEAIANVMKEEKPRKFPPSLFMCVHLILEMWNLIAPVQEDTVYL